VKVKFVEIQKKKKTRKNKQERYANKCMTLIVPMIVKWRLNIVQIYMFELHITIGHIIESVYNNTTLTCNSYC